MNRTQRGWMLAGIHVLLALSVAARFLYDRETLPRVWVRAEYRDSRTPQSGHYLDLALEVDYRGESRYNSASGLSLKIDNGRLAAVADPAGDHAVYGYEGRWRLSDPIRHFRPGGAPRVEADQELWVEVSLPRNGSPRPVRLGLRTAGGEIAPLE